MDSFTIMGFLLIIVFLIVILISKKFGGEFKFGKYFNFKLWGEKADKNFPPQITTTEVKEDDGEDNKNPSEPSSPKPEPELVLYLHDGKRNSPIKDQTSLSFPMPVTNSRYEFRFGLTLKNLNPTPEAQATGIIIVFTIDNRTNLSLSPQFLPWQREPGGWKIENSRITNENPAKFNFQDLDLISTHELDKRWPPFVGVLNEPVKGYFKISYTIRSINPPKKFDGTLKLEFE